MPQRKHDHRSSAKASRKRRNRARKSRRLLAPFERLEARLLLTGDFNYSAVDNTPLTLSTSGTDLVVLDSNDLMGTPLASMPIASIDSGVCIDSDSNNVQLSPVYRELGFPMGEFDQAVLITDLGGWSHREIRAVALRSCVV